jgi:hypothetical protein
LEHSPRQSTREVATVGIWPYQQFDPRAKTKVFSHKSRNNAYVVEATIRLHVETDPQAQTHCEDGQGGQYRNKNGHDRAVARRVNIVWCWPSAFDGQRRVNSSRHSRELDWQEAWPASRGRTESRLGETNYAE